MRTKLWSENLKGRGYSEDVGVDKKIILEWILGKCGGEVWTGFIWLRVGISDWLFGFHKSSLTS
jgi:hypothetical protein